MACVFKSSKVLRIVRESHQTPAEAEKAHQENEEADRKLFEKISAVRGSTSRGATKEEATTTSTVKCCTISMTIDSEQRGVRAAAAASTAQCDAKRAEVQRLREHLDKIRAGEDDEDALLLALAQSVGTTDPLSCMFLSQHVDTIAWYNTLITLGLCGMTLYYLFQTTCTDPGIIRPPTLKDVSHTEDESEAMELEAGQVPTVEGAMLPAEAFGPRRPSRRRYCDICGIEQDRSTDHCEDCGVCVAGYDHHCPWMGKCIGRDNMYAFKMFNVAWVVYVCFVLFIAILSVDWGHAAVQTLKRTASGEWVPTQTP
ncbi:hypothetical protein JG688_00013269 [Phytophthora aleatoria]|uniref:Palmitoyltransferase n=1 Tax=Phytophthora aleatoria TaxID=2496075 RepID=A0A8J5LYT9_9STRA|nr:hypothetical protein JG688_00013269 [Phytophthora aleatoria]